MLENNKEDVDSVKKYIKWESLDYGPEKVYIQFKKEKSSDCEKSIIKITNGKDVDYGPEKIQAAKHLQLWNWK